MRYYITRGEHSEAWQSFPGFYMGIPEVGYYQQGPAAERKAQEIANARGGVVHITTETRTTIAKGKVFRPSV
jgi:hypothetical protein